MKAKCVNISLCQPECTNGTICRVTLKVPKGKKLHGLSSDVHQNLMFTKYRSMRNFTKHIRHPGSNTKSTSLPGTGRKSTRPHKCVPECAENTTRVGTKPIEPPKPPGNVTKPTPRNW